MKEEQHREEYVMNESGIIFAGTYDNMFTWPWNFAQVRTVQQWYSLELRLFSTTMLFRFVHVHVPWQCCRESQVDRT